jgi:predicted RNA binding protein YcfA (HicA-like mRNA interferase family)
LALRGLRGYELDSLEKILRKLRESDLWREATVGRPEPEEAFAFDLESIHNATDLQVEEIEAWLDDLDELYGKANLEDAEAWGNENRSSGTVTLAWYQPITNYRDKAGIFVTDFGIQHYAALIQKKYSEFWVLDNGIGPAKLPGHRRLGWALEVLLLHEVFHHDVEWFSLKLNTIHSCQNLYDAYSQRVYSASGPLEESLATACMSRGMKSASFKKLFGTLISNIGSQALEERIARLPNGYKDANQYLTTKQFNFGKISLAAVINQLVPSPRFANWDKSLTIGKGGLSKYFLENALIVKSALNKSSVAPPESIAFSIPSKAIGKLMKRTGYEETNMGKGSHRVWKHPNQPAITLPARKDYEGYQVLKNICESLGYKTLHELRNAISNI